MGTQKLAYRYKFLLKVKGITMEITTRRICGLDRGKYEIEGSSTVVSEVLLKLDYLCDKFKIR